ncbi:enoyl reductase, partial [Colletotrichum incanum]
LRPVIPKTHHRSTLRTVTPLTSHAYPAASSPPEMTPRDAAGYRLPQSQTAVIVDGEDKVLVRHDAPCPQMQPDQVLVRTDAVAINPSDTKMCGGFANPSAILGSDYAGTVVAVGSDVSHVSPGDRVCGAQNEMFPTTPDRGAFAEYNVTRGHIWMKVPPSWTTEAAASLPVGVCTAGLAMRLLGLPLPNQPTSVPASVLVYGGSTATATIAIQLMRLSGYQPIAVCSPPNFHLALRNGAAATFDYRDHACGSKIRHWTKGNLRYALDCITNIESARICHEAIGRAGGRYVSLGPLPDHASRRHTVSRDWVHGPSIFGEGSAWPEPYRREPSEDLQRFGFELWKVVSDLVAAGRLQHHPLRILEGGLASVIDALEIVKNGLVSGEKIIVRLGTAANG